MKVKLNNIFLFITSLKDYLIDRYTDNDRLLFAKSIILLQSKMDSQKLSDYEFRVFSQWGDDGIIQYLINNTKILNKNFVEFGVQDYKESNTRFLLMNNNWSGLVMDGSDRFIKSIKRQGYYWKYDLQAWCKWITKDNINCLLNKTGWEDIGLLHIDIDGNDYWIWDAIEEKKFRPTIVIIEYNSVFGSQRAISVPYSDDFYRTKEHYSNLYFGCSLKALINLSKKKGYVFVGCNSNGNNAYFIKKDRLQKVKEVSLSQGYIESKFRESRSRNGELSYLRSKNRLELIKGLPVVDTENMKIQKL